MMSWNGFLRILLGGSMLVACWCIELLKSLRFAVVLDDLVVSHAETE
jgi:hypothetical protein